MLSSLIMFIVTICFQKSDEKRYKVNFYNLRRNFIDIGLFIFVAENVFGMTKIISEWIFGERDKYFVKKHFFYFFTKSNYFSNVEINNMTSKTTDLFYFTTIMNRFGKIYHFGHFKKGSLSIWQNIELSMVNFKCYLANFSCCNCLGKYQTNHVVITVHNVVGSNPD